MGQKIRNIVPARIEVKFMRDFERIEGLVHFARAAIETERVFGAAIEIDLYPR